MNDRTPTYPGRVIMTPVSGKENTYEMTMADEPVAAGTPPTKANLLTDATAALLGNRMGLTAPETVNAALAMLGNRNLWNHGNLLLNADFRNPVNTIGETTYSGKTETVDGWSLTTNYGEATLESDGIKVSATVRGSTTLREYTQAVPAGRYTVSVLVGSSNASFSLGIWHLDNTDRNTFTVSGTGLFSATFDLSSPGSLYFGFSISAGRSVKIIAAKLESGDTQTLAHQDASGNWVVNGAENYLEELAKAKAGNSARIQAGSYVGTGTKGPDNPNELTFDFTPKLVLLTLGGVQLESLTHSNDGSPPFVVWFNPETTEWVGIATYANANYTLNVPIVWEKNKVSWYANPSASYLNYTAREQYNESGVTYYYVAIG